MGPGFLHGQFNDLLLLPAALPWLLWLQARLGIRRHDGAPTGREVALHVIVWSFVCELWGPKFFHHGTSDWRDCVAYAFGGLISWLIWNHGGIRERARV